MSYETLIAEAAVAWIKRRISERTRMAMAHKRRRNERVGQVPYGRDLANDGVTLIENPSEQRTIALITQLRSDGMSLRKIAAELDRRKVPTKRGATKWCHMTVSHIVKQKDR